MLSRIIDSIIQIKNFILSQKNVYQNKLLVNLFLICCIADALSKSYRLY